MSLKSQLKPKMTIKVNGVWNLPKSISFADSWIY